MVLSAGRLSKSSATTTIGKLWHRRKPWVYVKTVGRGQEFVFDASGIPEANVWLRELFR